jgi:hypothetical protein
MKVVCRMPAARGPPPAPHAPLPARRRRRRHCRPPAGEAQARPRAGDAGQELCGGGEAYAAGVRHVLGVRLKLRAVTAAAAAPRTRRGAGRVTGRGDAAARCRPAPPGGSCVRRACLIPRTLASPALRHVQLPRQTPGYAARSGAPLPPRKSRGPSPLAPPRRARAPPSLPCSAPSLPSRDSSSRPGSPPAAAGAAAGTPPPRSLLRSPRAPL